MALPVISNVYRVAFEWVNNDNPQLVATNVMHFQMSSGTPALVAAAIDTHVTANMWAAQSSHSHVNQLNVTALDGSGVTLPLPIAFVAKWAGVQSSGSPVPNVANIIKFVTAKRGRSYRGRVFLPWTDEEGMTQGKVDTGNVTAITAAWAAFLVAMTAVPCIPVVASYKLATAEPIVAAASEVYVATMRRRQHRTSATG